MSNPLLLNVLSKAHHIWPTNLALAAGTVGTIAVAEMAIRSVGDLMEYFKESNSEKIKDKALDNLSANLGGALFYGMCATNILPGSAVIGGAIFIIHSILSCTNDDAYLSSKIIGKPVHFVVKDVLLPLIDKVASAVFNVLLKLGDLLLIPLKHPIWAGVFLMGAAITTYKVAQSLL